MSEILRRPWIFEAVSKSLNPVSSQQESSQSLAHFQNKSQLVQIAQFILSSSGTTHILANLSDKFNYIVAFFTSLSIGSFAANHPTWRLTDLQGSIIRLSEFKFVQIPSAPGSLNTIILVVEKFEFVGSQGSPTFGDPRYIMNNQSICKILEEQANKNISSQVDISFSQNLDAADLLFLETTCTQTLERVRSSFPQVIHDSDWIIPDDQLAILNNVDYARISKFEFQSDTEFYSAASSDVEPASPVRRQRLPVSPTKLNESSQSQNAFGVETLAFTQAQANSLPSMTQPFTQNSPTRTSRIRIIEKESSPPSSRTTLTSSPSTPKRAKVSQSQPRTQTQTQTQTQTPSQIESVSSQKTLPVRFPSSPDRDSKAPASPPKKPMFEFPDYSAW